MEKRRKRSGKHPGKFNPILFLCSVIRKGHCLKVLHRTKGRNPPQQAHRWWWQEKLPFNRKNLWAYWKSLKIIYMTLVLIYKKEKKRFAFAERKTSTLHTTAQEIKPGLCHSISKHNFTTTIDYQWLRSDLWQIRSHNTGNTKIAFLLVSWPTFGNYVLTFNQTNHVSQRQLPLNICVFHDDGKEIHIVGQPYGG